MRPVCAQVAVDRSGCPQMNPKPLRKEVPRHAFGNRLKGRLDAVRRAPLAEDGEGFAMLDDGPAGVALLRAPLLNVMVQRSTKAGGNPVGRAVGGVATRVGSLDLIA